MTPHLLSLATIAGLYLLAVVSPGPNFFVISQLSLSGRRRSAVLVALGIAAGSLTWALLSMFGVAAVLTRIAWLYAAIRLAGAIYLVWFGLRLIGNAACPRPRSSRQIVAMRPVDALRAGLLTSLTNPKSGVFWTSVFASVFPPGAPAWLYAFTAVMVAVLSLGWHLGIALVFTSAAVQAGYNRFRRVLDAVCGLLMVALGSKLAIYR